MGVDYGKLAAHVASGLGALHAYGQEDTAAAKSLQYVLDELMAAYEAAKPEQPVGCASEKELIAHIAQRVSCLDNTVFRNTPANCKIFAIYAVEGMKNLRVPMRESGIQTIDTAPRDGTRILIYVNKGWVEAMYDRTEVRGHMGSSRILIWHTSYGSIDIKDKSQPTHWMPLPQPAITDIEGQEP